MCGRSCNVDLLLANVDLGRAANVERHVDPLQFVEHLNGLQEAFVGAFHHLRLGDAGRIDGERARLDRARVPAKRGARPSVPFPPIGANQARNGT